MVYAVTGSNLASIQQRASVKNASQAPQRTTWDDSYKNFDYTDYKQGFSNTLGLNLYDSKHVPTSTFTSPLTEMFVTNNGDILASISKRLDTSSVSGEKARYMIDKENNIKGLSSGIIEYFYNNGTLYGVTGRSATYINVVDYDSEYNEVNKFKRSFINNPSLVVNDSNGDSLCLNMTGKVLYKFEPSTRIFKSTGLTLTTDSTQPAVTATSFNVLSNGNYAILGTTIVDKKTYYCTVEFDTSGNEVKRYVDDTGTCKGTKLYKTLFVNDTYVYILGENTSNGKKDLVFVDTNGNRTHIDIAGKDINNLTVVGDHVAACYDGYVDFYDMSGSHKGSLSIENSAIGSVCYSDGKIFVAYENNDWGYKLNDTDTSTGNTGYVACFARDGSASEVVKIHTTEDKRTVLGTVNKDTFSDYYIVESDKDSDRVILTLDRFARHKEIALFNKSEFRDIFITTDNSKYNGMLTVQTSENGTLYNHYYWYIDQLYERVSAGADPNYTPPSVTPPTTPPSTPTPPQNVVETRVIIDTEDNGKTIMNIIDADPNTDEIIVSIYTPTKITDIDSITGWDFKDFTSDSSKFTLTLTNNRGIDLIKVYGNDGSLISSEEVDTRTQLGTITLNDGREISAVEGVGVDADKLLLCQKKDGVHTDKVDLNDYKYTDMSSTADGGYSVIVVKPDKTKWKQKYSKDSILLDETPVIENTNSNITIVITVNKDGSTNITVNGTDVNVPNFSAGSSSSSGGNTVIQGTDTNVQVSVVVVTPSGDVITNRSITGATNVRLTCYLQLSNGNYILAGSGTDTFKSARLRNSYNLFSRSTALDKTGLMVEFSPDGKELSRKFIPSSYGEGGDSTITRISEHYNGVVEIGSATMPSTLANIPTYFDNRGVVNTVDLSNEKTIVTVKDSSSADTYTIKSCTDIYEYDVKTFTSGRNPVTTLGTNGEYFVTTTPGKDTVVYAFNKNNVNTDNVVVKGTAIESNPIIDSITRNSNGDIVVSGPNIPSTVVSNGGGTVEGVKQYSGRVSLPSGTESKLEVKEGTMVEYVISESITGKSRVLNFRDVYETGKMNFIELIRADKSAYYINYKESSTSPIKTLGFAEGGTKEYDLSITAKDSRALEHSMILSGDVNSDNHELRIVKDDVDGLVVTVYKTDSANGNSNFYSHALGDVSIESSSVTADGGFTVTYSRGNSRYINTYNNEYLYLGTKSLGDNSNENGSVGDNSNGNNSVGDNGSSSNNSNVNNSNGSDFNKNNSVIGQLVNTGGTPSIVPISIGLLMTCVGYHIIRKRKVTETTKNN